MVSRRQIIQSSTLATILPAMATYSTQSTAQSDNRYGIQGSYAPEITQDYWIDATGEQSEFSIGAQKGKWVYLYCFQDWCPGCHAHGFPALQQLSAEFPQSDVLSIAAIQTVFEGFSSNTLEDVRKLQLKYELAIPMGHDAGNPDGDHRPKTMKDYRTGGTPWTVIIDPNGVVAFNDFHVNIDKFIEFIAKA
jgi:thiol-disulfide isomerase/thioredoxin